MFHVKPCGNFFRYVRSLRVMFHVKHYEAQDVVLKLDSMNYILCQDPKHRTNTALVFDADDFYGWVSVSIYINRKMNQKNFPVFAFMQLCGRRFCQTANHFKRLGLTGIQISGRAYRNNSK